MKGITDSIHYEGIADALRAANNTTRKYTPAQMAAAVGDMLGLTEFIKNNMLSLKRVFSYTTESQASGIIFYNDDTHFYCLPSNDKVNAGLSFVFNNGAFHPSTIQFMQNDTVATGMCAPDENALLLTGIQNYLPLMSQDVTPFTRTNHTKLRFNDSYNANLLNFPAQLLQMDENLTHPLILQAFANENVISFYDFLYNYSAGLFDIINTGFVPPEYYGTTPTIYNAYVYVTPDDQRLIIDAYVDVEGWRGELSFDTNKLVGSTWFFGDEYNLNSRIIHDKINISLAQSAAPTSSHTQAIYTQFTSAEIVQQRFIYATSDIKDENDNVIFQANLSVDEFISWVNYPTT